MDAGEDFRSPQGRERIIKTLESVMKNRPFQLNSRVPSDPRQLEQMLFETSPNKEDYMRKVNKILQMASGQAQQAQHQQQQPVSYDMNMGGGVNAPQRGGPMMSGPPQHMMSGAGGLPPDPMQQQQQTQQQAPPNATISTGPLPQQQHYGMDGQGRLLPPPNPYGQQQQMGGGMAPQTMGMQGTQGGMMVNMQGQPGQQQPQQQHMMQPTAQHRMIARQPTPAGMRMGQPGQPMMMTDVGQRYGMPGQERPDMMRMNQQQQQQQQRFARASMPPQHSMQQPGHWNASVMGGGGGVGPPPVSTVQQTISDTVVVTHFGPGGMPVRHHPSITTARNDLSANAGTMYQPTMQQSYPTPRMMAQQPPPQPPQPAPSGMGPVQAARYDSPTRMPPTSMPQYQRHPGPPMSQPMAPAPSIPQAPLMGPPSAPATSTPAYMPMQSPATAVNLGPSPAALPPPALQEQSPVYTNASVESVGAQNRYNVPTEPSPAQAQADGALTEDPGYKAKIQELHMYLDPLKRMLEQHQKDGDSRNSQQTQKLLKIIDIIEGKSKATLDLLLKCEETLKKMVHKEPAKTRESSLCQPLFDVVASLARNPNANQTLKRVFDLPSIDLSTAKRLCAPKNPEDPTPRTIEEAFVMKMAQLGQDTSTDPITKSESKTTDSSRVPVSIQREVASLEPRFRITFDRGAPPAAETGLTKADTARVIQVVCDLVDRKLPPVPALRLQIPNDYPVSSPKYDYELVDYCGSELLDRMRDLLMMRLTKLGSNCSITSLLDTWENTVRHACLSK